MIKDVTFLSYVDPFGLVWVAIWDQHNTQAVAYDTIHDFMVGNEYRPDEVTSELEDFSPMAIQHAVKEFYLRYGNADAKRLFGVDDRPYTVCVYCGKTVRWNGVALIDPDREEVTWNGTEVAGRDGGEFCEPPDRQPGVAYAEHGHEGRWLTLGEFRDRTSHLPDNMPITADTQNETWEGKDVDSWINLRLVDVPETWDPEDSAQPSLILDARDDFDTRQW